MSNPILCRAVVQEVVEGADRVEAEEAGGCALKANPVAVGRQDWAVSGPKLGYEDCLAPGELIMGFEWVVGSDGLDVRVTMWVGKGEFGELGALGDELEAGFGNSETDGGIGLVEEASGVGEGVGGFIAVYVAVTWDIDEVAWGKVGEEKMDLMDDWVGGV